MAKSKVRQWVYLGTCQGCGREWTLSNSSTMAAHPYPGPLGHKDCPGGGHPPLERKRDIADLITAGLKDYADGQDALARNYAVGIGVPLYRTEERRGELVRVSVTPDMISAEEGERQAQAAAAKARTAASDARSVAKRLASTRRARNGRKPLKRALPRPGDRIKLKLPDKTLDNGTIGVVADVDMVAPGLWDIAVHWSNGRDSTIQFPLHPIRLIGA